MSAETLNLQGNLAEEWTSFVNILNHSAITLSEDEDQLRWTKNSGPGDYTVKLGYATKLEEDMVEERVWLSRDMEIGIPF